MRGKLSIEQLNNKVLSVLKKRRKEVLQGGKQGEDCAVLKLNDYVILSTDPITCAGENIGKLAIDVCVNDIASSGGEPLCALLTILSPEDESVENIQKIMQDAEFMAEKYNLEIVGGHTEYTDSVNKTIVICAILGICKKPIFSTTMQVGDDILITKTAGIEGSSIIAKDYIDKLDFLTAKDLESIEVLDEQISVLKEGKILSKLDISAMHDITEGGVYGAIFELISGKDLSCEVWENKIPLAPVTKKICDNLQISPYKLISSGSMLVFAKNGEKIANELAKNGINCTVIGRVIPKSNFALKIIDTNQEIMGCEEELHKVKLTPANR